MILAQKNEDIQTIYLEFLDILNGSGNRIYSIFDGPKYRDTRIKALFCNMLYSDFKSTPVTLDDMLSFMSESSSRSTRLRLIEMAKTDGHILSIRKKEMDDPSHLNQSGAKKAFYLSDDIRTKLLEQLDKSIQDVLAFAARHADEVDI